MKTIYVDKHGNVIQAHEGSEDLYYWTSDGELYCRRTSRSDPVSVTQAVVPWPALVALAGIKSALIYKDIVRIDRSPAAFVEGFWDGKNKDLWFAELLPAGFAELLPAEDDVERLGSDGDIAWAIYDEALRRAAVILLS